jgi:hypothetical protein
MTMATRWETGTNAPTDAQIEYAEDLLHKLDEARIFGYERLRIRFAHARTKQDVSQLIRDAKSLLKECDDSDEMMIHGRG